MPPRPSPISPWLAALLALALFGWGSAAPREAGADGAARAGPTDPAPDIRAALLALSSPYLAERDEAAARLIADLPLAREPALAAFRTASGPARLALVSVLASDASAGSLDLLLSTLVKTEDPALGGAIRRALADHAEDVSKAVEGYRDASGKVPPRIEELSSILRRARIEALFLAKKSRSGSTGYYHGQFDALKAYREDALHVLLAILKDEAFKWPGEFPAGSYRFLRPPAFLLDRVEVRDLAANAIAELMTSSDAWLVAELQAYYEQLEREAKRDEARRARKGGANPLSLADALLDVVLATLARHAQGPYRDLVDDRVRVLIDRDASDEAASIELRLGEYRKAIQLYVSEIRRGHYVAIPYYNVACAYAIWSREIEADDPERAAEFRQDGIANLARSIANGYMDWPWMEQDRDLDALRGEAEYPALLRRIKEEFVLPGTPPEPAGPGPSMGERVPPPFPPVATPAPAPPMGDGSR